MADRRGERGTTLPEVLVVMAMSALVLVPVFGVLRSSLRQEQVQVQAIERESQLRLVSGRLSDDIRSGAPSDRSSAPSEELALEFGGDRSELVTWFANGPELRRRVTDIDTGSVTADVVLLDTLTRSEPLFRYWALDGTEVTANIASCAVRVTASLEISSANGATSVKSIDIAHRTKNQEADPCP